MRHAPWTGPETVLSFRRLYLPNGTSAADWRQSPLLVPTPYLSSGHFPSTFVMLMELDLFFGEGKALIDRLRQCGHDVEEEIVLGYPHMALGMCKMFPRVLSDLERRLKMDFHFDTLLDWGGS